MGSEHKMRGFPAWQDAAAYPSAESYLNPTGLAQDANYPRLVWAWQFLRRNPSYQEAYALSRQPRVHRSTVLSPRQFHLAWFLPYRDEDPGWIPFVGIENVRIVTAEETQQEQLSIAPTEIAIVISLERPLLQQLSMARTEAEEHIAARLRKSKTGRGLAKGKTPTFAPPKHTRYQYGALSRYLRVLDALAQEATPKTIATRFLEDGTYAETKSAEGYDGQKDIERDIQRAKKYRDQDYIKLAYPPSPNRPDKRLV